jgi:LuxR family transcriptional regulator, maltose regulon positive regulatory protein
MVQAALPLTSLSEAQRAQAQERFEIIRPAWEKKMTQADVARTHQISLRTVQRWIKSYREQGLAGLTDQERSDKGASRSLPQEAIRLIEGLALQTPPRSVASIHRQIITIAGEQGWKPPSYGRVSQIIKGLDVARTRRVQHDDMAFQNYPERGTTPASCLEEEVLTQDGPTEMGDRKASPGKAEALIPQRLEETVGKRTHPPIPHRTPPANKPNTFLRTKLLVPPLPPYVISRPHLLQQAASRTLTVLTAPAGYGKTTLLSQWATTSAMPVAWLSLHEEENDPQSFLIALLAACHPFGPGIEQALVPLQESERGLLTRPLSALINELVALTSEVTLILDNYQVITTPEIHHGLRFLLDHLPPQVHVLLATRTRLPFSLVRFCVRGQAVEVGAEALRFSQEETERLLSAVPLTLSAEDRVQMDRLAEGWPAGLRLLILALQAGESLERISRSGPAQRAIQDYLVEEVLTQQSVPMQTFLLSTALLDRFHPALCGALVEQADAQHSLEQLEQDQLFLVPLDEPAGWYRYHRLFALTLRHYLQRSQPDLVTLVHRRASQWFEQHDLLEEAITHHLAVHESAHAAALIEQVVHTLVGQAQITQVQRWLQALPAEIIRSSPRLCITSALVLLLTTPVHSVLCWLDDAEEALTARKDHLSVQEGESLRSEIVALRALSDDDCPDVSNVVETCQRLLAALAPENAYARSLLLLALHQVYLQAINLAAAAQALVEARIASQRTRHTVLISEVMFRQVTLCTAQGDLRQAFQLCQQLLHLTNGQPGYGTGMATFSMGYFYWEWGNADAARASLLEAWQIGQQLQNTFLIINSAALLAHLSQAQGDTDEATAWLHRLEAHVQELALSEEVAFVDTMRARLSLEQGALEEALLWVQSQQGLPEEAAARRNEFEQVALARILIAAGKTFQEEVYLSQASAILDQLQKSTEAMGQTKWLIETLTLRVLLLHQQEDRAGALAALERALTLAEPGRFIRVFVEKGDAMTMLLRQVREQSLAGNMRKHSQHLLYVRTLLSAWTHPVVHAAPPLLPHQTSQVPVPELLSGREQEVLRLMADGKRNQEIARALVVEVGTVKSHTNSIYRKLAVENRVQAITRARALHLL